MTMFVTAIVAAGGRGTRFGAAGPKQLLAVGGRPILERSVRAFADHPSVHEIVVAMLPELVADPPAYLRRSAKPLHLVAGGSRRQDSVANAFRAASEQSDLVVIHDAARPFVAPDLITRTLEAAAECGAALAALPARDTVKVASVPPGHSDREAGYVDQTLPREVIFLAQTPQAFRRDVLRDALALGIDATDEASLVERAGHRVRLVEGDALNIKITAPEDLVIADGIARWQTGRSELDGRGSFDRSPERLALRSGTGYDLHRLLPGRPLVLGGVTIASDRGPLGHSDADVVCHAVTDAILGAACRGDIGQHFPDSDPRWKDASSLDLLGRVVAMVREDGLDVGNVDVTVILETPKIHDHIDAMRSAVAAAIGINRERVSIKAKTNEGLDAIGRGEAVAAHAIALLRRV